jgi:hypothetical protein
MMKKPTRLENLKVISRLPGFHRVKRFLSTIPTRVDHYLYPPDLYFASFAKSGRTWIRVFLSRYYSLKTNNEIGIDFEKKIHSPAGVPKIIFHHFGGDKIGKPSQYKSISTLNRKNVVLLVRDPRDTFISFFFHRTRREILSRDEGIEWKKITMDELLKHPIYGVKGIIDYLNEFYSFKNMYRNFLLVRYENFMHCPEEEFTTLLEFLGESRVDKSMLFDAIEYSSFRNMRTREEKMIYDDHRLKPTNEADPNSFKVREGKVGGYVNYLKGEQIAFCEQIMRTLHRDLQYITNDNSCSYR